MQDSDRTDNTERLLEDWQPFRWKNGWPQLTKTEKSIVRRVGRAIAAQTLQKDIPVLIDVSSGRVPRTDDETRMANYIRGVFDMAGRSPIGRRTNNGFLLGLSMEFALAGLKTGKFQPSGKTMNLSGPRLRGPGNDWTRF